MSEFRVLLVDDQELFRGVCRSAPIAFAKLYPGKTIEMKYAKSVKAARGHLDESADWNLILVDLNLEDENGEEGGLRYIKELTANKDKDVPPYVALFSATNSIQPIRECLTSGATGFISKDAGPVEEFCAAIYELVTTGRHVSPETMALVARKEPKPPRLTGSESAVVEKLLENKTIAEIADELEIQATTVNRYARSAYTKYSRGSVTCLLLMLLRDEADYI